MTARFYAQLVCEAEGCRSVYPAQPERYSAHGEVSRTVTAIRASAATEGWETKRGPRWGKDMCPPCRIAEIRQQEGIDPSHPNTGGER